ncbi:MAG: ectoine/hydroxyectoine ABC transporter ATP-binding protein EhuA, partial [Mesorhizobium sp.]
MTVLDNPETACNEKVMNEPMVRFENVTKRYGALTVLD